VAHIGKSLVTIRACIVQTVHDVIGHPGDLPAVSLGKFTGRDLPFLCMPFDAVLCFALCTFFGRRIIAIGDLTHHTNRMIGTRRAWFLAGTISLPKASLQRPLTAALAAFLRFDLVAHHVFCPLNATSVSTLQVSDLVWAAVDLGSARACCRIWFAEVNGNRVVPATFRSADMLRSLACLRARKIF